MEDANVGQGPHSNQPDDTAEEVQQTWRLEFKCQPRLPIHAGSRITDATGNPLEIIVDDAETGHPWPFPMELDIKLVPLKGYFPPHEDWSAEDFEAAIVKQLPGNVPLLKGDTDIFMKDGRATVDMLQFMDDPSRGSGRMFRIGACVVPRASSNNGTGRILEAVTEPFVVNENPNPKHPPELDDPVWRLEMIDKDGEVHRNLTSNNVDTVKEFLRMLHVKEDELRELLVGDRMTHQMRLMTIGHAKNCDAGQEVYKYSGADGTIYVDSVFREVFKVEVHRARVKYDPLDALDVTQMLFVGKLVLEAYEHRDNLHKVDVGMQMELRDHKGIETSSLLGKNAMDELRLKLLTSEQHKLSTLQSETFKTFPGSDHRPVDRMTWMEELGPHRLRVHQVVWPGTHGSWVRPLQSVGQKLVMGARFIDLSVSERRLCRAPTGSWCPVQVVFDDVKEFLAETESEVVILEICTGFGPNDPPEFDKFLVEQLGDYLIRQDDAVFNKTIAELLPKRVICVWKPRKSPAPKPGELLWSARYLRDNWTGAYLSVNEIESNLKFLGQQPPVADRKFFYHVRDMLAQHADPRDYARVFIAHVFAKGLGDKLQVFSTDYIQGDFVDACVGVTKARVEGAA